ncbi:2-hydroxyacid dehydrogenase [Acidocella sp.]|uniref:2-hydroxyacid dehydrogenase n=1 Tax=Acidocella sp. TaxID=50710 RepID=UPI00261D3138|nr:2-hydroxyacid dehydrogenase [Acidocella sp.]
MTDKPKILSVGGMDPRVEEALAPDFEVLSTRAALLDSLVNGHGPDILALVTRGQFPVNAALIAALPKLQLIANYGVGYDTVDCAAAAARRVIVTHTPDVLNDEMADFTIGLMLATIRQLPQAEAYLRSGGWEARGMYPLTASLRDRKIGIAGLGRIGQTLAQRLQAFRRPVAYYARTARPHVNLQYFASLEDLAEAVDVLIVLLPGGAATRHAINAAVLNKLGPNGILINVARGSVVDETALIAALREGAILAAGLDVFEDEPRVPQALRDCANAVLTPHIGTGTYYTRGLMGDLVIANIRSWFAGQGPLTPVPETPWPPPALA